jgi:hypothetical protein
MVKRRFSNRLASDEITTHGYMTLISVECTIVITVAHTVMSGLGYSRD